jgi:hypothetical protein
MRMSHIYQPVMIRELVKRGGKASIRNIAAAFLARDTSQLEYYEQLKRHTCVFLGKAELKALLAGLPIGHHPVKKLKELRTMMMMLAMAKLMRNDVINFVNRRWRPISTFTSAIRKVRGSAVPMRTPTVC